MKSLIVVLMFVFAVCCCCPEEAGAQTLDIGLERASIAQIVPMTSSGESATAYVFNFKMLEILEPEQLTLGNLPQILAARLTVDLLLISDDGSLPLSFEEANAAVGASLPLLSTSGEKTDVRAGITYTERSKAATYFSLGYQF